MQKLKVLEEYLPACFSPSTAAVLTSYTRTGYPLLTRFLAMWFPMFPRPINPIRGLPPLETKNQPYYIVL